MLLVRYQAFRQCVAQSRYEHASKRGVSAWRFYVLIGKLPLPDANTNRIKNVLWSTSLFLSAWATGAQDSTVAKVGHRAAGKCRAMQGRQECRAAQGHRKCRAAQGRRGHQGRRAAGGQRLNQQDKRGIRR